MSSKPAIRPRPPSVEAVLKRLRPSVDGLDPEAVASAVRDVVAEERSSLAAGTDPRDPAALADVARARLDAFSEAGLIPVINATGVIVHTNLGRASWPSVVSDAVARATREPLLLELDRETGRRGRRARIAEDHLVALTGAEDALVTNNNAGSARPRRRARRARRRRRGVSRRAGRDRGGVRIPEIIRRAGSPIDRGRDDQSNAERGFRRAAGRGPGTCRPARPSLELRDDRVHRGARSARGRRPGPQPWLRWSSMTSDPVHCSTPRHSASPTSRCRPSALAAGSDVVTFSGDKLVGGPQAGLIVGQADLVARMRRDPLARAMRPDKVTMAGVAVTLGLYRSGRAIDGHPGLAG
jgi:L-seryl-tRNA(Ser) seleniumtransferase